MTEPTEADDTLIDLDEDDDTFEEAATGQAPAEDDFDTYDMPPVLCGVFCGHASRVSRNPKKPKKQLIIEFKSEDAETLGATASCFLTLADRRDWARLRAIAGTLGCTIVPTKGGGFRIEGGEKSMKNKPCYFVVETYRKDGEVNSSLARGMPKDDKSPEWKAYKASAGFSTAQLKAISGSPGVIDVDTWRKLS